LKIEGLVILSVISFLILFPAVVLAQEEGVPIEILRVLFGPDVPSEWADRYHFMQYLMFPFLAIWLVIFGIFEEIRIFRRRPGVTAGIAFLVAAVSGPTGGLVTAVNFMLASIGMVGMVLFWALTMIGMFLWFLGRMFLWTGLGGSYGRRMAGYLEIEKRESELEQQMREARMTGNTALEMELLKMWKESEEERQKLLKERAKEAKGGRRRL